MHSKANCFLIAPILTLVALIIGFALGAYVLISMQYEVWEVPPGQFASTTTLSGGGDFINFQYPHALILDVYADEKGSAADSTALTRLGASLPPIEKTRFAAWNEAVWATGEFGHKRTMHPIIMIVNQFDNLNLVAAEAAGIRFIPYRGENKIPGFIDLLLMIAPRRPMILSNS